MRAALLKKQESVTAQECAWESVLIVNIIFLCVASVVSLYVLRALAGPTYVPWV
jgi:hypothetical protein